MGTELFATYFVYLLALVAVRYSRHSWVIYLLICFLERGVWGGEKYQIISPFYLGVLLADTETRENPPLNYLRQDTKVAKIIKFVMFVLAVLWSSEVCMWDLPDLFGFVLFENYTDINAPFFILIVVLTSDTCRWILETWFMKFLGKISFMMYLIHPLIFGGFMADFYIYLVWKKTDP
jgi:peptidoglycan/LPS O-acetylase OafA/YrhL